MSSMKAPKHQTKSNKEDTYDKQKETAYTKKAKIAPNSSSAAEEKMEGEGKQLPDAQSLSQKEDEVMAEQFRSLDSKQRTDATRRSTVSGRVGPLTIST